MDGNESYYFERNPIFRVLVGNGKGGTRRFALILLGWYFVAYLVCGCQSVLWIPGKQLGLIEDLVMLSVFPMLVSTVALTLRLLRKLEFLLSRLPEITECDTLQDSGSRVNDYVTADIRHIRDFVSLRTRRSRLWYVAWLTFMALLVYFFQIHIPLFVPQEIGSWALLPRSYPIAFGFALVWALFQWVVVVGSTTWYVLSVAVKIFSMLHRYAHEGRLIVIPMAPDGKGGLSPIGDVGFAITLVISCGMLMVVAWLITFGADLSVMVGFSVYLGFLVGLFFLPLMSVHTAMKNAKASEAMRLCALFRNEYAKLPGIAQLREGRSSDSHRLDVLETIVCLGQLEHVYRRVTAMPVWPFDMRTLGRFASVVMIPLLLFVIQVATQDVLTSWLQGSLKL